MENEKAKDINKPMNSYLVDGTAKKKDDDDAYKRGVKDQKKAGRVILSIAILGAAIVGGAVGAGIYSVTNANKKSHVSALTEEIYSYLVNNWLYAGTYDDLDATLNNLMISGMLDNDGDPYTFYTSTAAAQGLDTSGSGKFGVSLSPYATADSSGIVHGGFYIKDIFDGTFKAAGFLKGDVIIAAKKSEAEGYTVFDTISPSEASSLITPDKSGDLIYFKYLRNGEIKEQSCTTGDYSQTSTYLVNDIASADGKRTVTIKISTFLGTNDNSPAAITKTILNSALKEGDIDRLVFDCRDNGGGYTNSAVDLSDLFLPYGKIVYQDGDLKGNIKDVYKQSGNQSFTIPDIRIILNGGSASATELFAKALKDNGLATVYGCQSYGKGISQSVIPLQNGGVLRITTAKIFGPDGKSIQGVGITPDVQTNTYYTYGNNLVYTPYISDSYRLTYAQEQEILTVLQTTEAYKGYTDITSALKAFQNDQGITASGEYDTYTLYRIYKMQLDKIYQGTAAETATVEGI